MKLHPEILQRINLPKDDPKQLWINELELTSTIVNLYVATTVTDNERLCFDWQPLLYYGGNNKSANQWSKEPAHSNKFY